MGGKLDGQPAERRDVRALRLNAGMTVGELAATARVAMGTIHGLEHGRRSLMLDREVERRVARALGVEPDRIAWGEVGDETAPSFNLRTAREDRELSPGDVGARAGVPLRTVVRAEAGCAIHPRYAKRLADFYGTEVVAFYPIERAAA